MPDRSWFFAWEGKQQGPYPETQFRTLLGRGTIAADALVWTDGMAGWQKASDIPGLIPGSASAPARFAQGREPARAGGAPAAGGALSLDAELWPLFGWSLLYGVGLAVVIPAPWTATGFYRWFVPRLQVPGRPNLEFTGQVGDIWYVFIILGLLNFVPRLLSFLPGIQLLVIVATAFLAWMIYRWLVSHVSSNGQALQLAFEGSPLQYVGWYLLMMISIITIVGWAWVLPAWMRWICRNISGTRREITFNAPGLEVLWRTLVFGIASAFLIPIPWVLRWYLQWFVSQFALVARS
jgi:hypothetical protein